MYAGVVPLKELHFVGASYRQVLSHLHAVGAPLRRPRVATT